MSFKKFFSAVLPPVPKTEDRQTLQFLSSVKKALDELKNNIVISDQGIVASKGSLAASDDITASSETDLSAFAAPSAPTGVEASGAIENIILEWQYSGAPIGKFEIWRSLTDDIGQAELRGVTEALVFLDGVGPGATFYYWVRGVSTGGVEGPYQGVNGVEGATSEDPLSEIIRATESLNLSTLTSELSETGFGIVENGGNKTFAVLADRFAMVDPDNDQFSPFFVADNRVYIDAAFIRNASISSAQISSLAADKIAAANLSAISANMGTITAGVLRGPNSRFKIDLANNRLEVFDTSGTLRVRIGDI